MVSFTPNAATRPQVVFFEDARKDDGWQGHGTAKNQKTLTAELFAAINRLNGVIPIGLVEGTFEADGRVRHGFRIMFQQIRDDGTSHPGQIDIAALPCRNPQGRSGGGRGNNREQSLRMALYMARDAFNGMWFLAQLSPGLVPLLPFLIEPGSGKTFTQLYAMPGQFSRLLPEPGSTFIEGEFE